MYTIKRAACALLAALFLISCGKSFKFKNDEYGNLIDEENGRYYIYCLGYLRAAEMKKPVYATGDGKPKKEKLYEIPGADPAEWLTEDITMGIPFLFREQGVEEPTLAGFETKKIHITQTEAINVRIGLIEDKEDIDLIINEFLNGDKEPYPDYITDYFSFWFESDKYPGIYFVLNYLVDDNDKGYLYDRWTDLYRCAPCSIKPFGDVISAATGQKES